ncbi:salt tolerance down-regulator-domain-containing protein [Bombardia bombarda]|uniref:Stress response protein NST1 n=1 Tax=Bombardia bombarda TaxID=252184 RepID=A0AA39WUL9_9PEZI|nr:salt tolerance down-regulator-domain-containing protein [Bombardia bombarda]
MAWASGMPFRSRSVHFWHSPPIVQCRIDTAVAVLGNLEGDCPAASLHVTKEEAEPPTIPPACEFRCCALDSCLALHRPLLALALAPLRPRPRPRPAPAPAPALPSPTSPPPPPSTKSALALSFSTDRRACRSIANPSQIRSVPTMKGNRHPPLAPPTVAPLSPASKATAKYKNKDGSKFITVPKGSTPVDSSQPSPTEPTATDAKGAPQTISPASPLGPVNRKKQKRRAKAAAKAAAEHDTSGQSPNGLPRLHPSHDQQSAEADPDDSNDEDEQYDDRDDRHHHHHHENGFAEGGSTGKKSKKKKKKHNAGSNTDEPPDVHHDYNHLAETSDTRTLASPSSVPTQHHRPGISKEKIWNTSSAEERERIKEFWLGLSEIERKSLVKVEKDAVLKKMKEQQKHTCSCTVCGRKRTAIEEELEGLYDAYYLELEQYANHPNQGDGPPMLRPHHSFGAAGGVHPRGLPASYSNHQPSHGRIVEHVGDDEEDDGEEDYSDDELDEDEYSEEEPSEELHRSDYAAEFFNFGNSLTVQGGILTVADDLLKNDGKKFIEMMEQLAERRMAREEDAREQFDRGFSHVNGDRPHYHPPPEEQDFDEEEEEDYEDEDDEEFDSQEEEDTMTEEQRMEEGRRMFQIFAARMFEQRVLTAYREKVAKERQAKLLEELEDESRQESQRKAKKAKEAQKRKDKAAKKKELQAEEKARKEAEKAAEEASRLAEEARKLEEQRVKTEEKRKKKEAQKLAEDEERKRREVERLRRAQEKEETERKLREVKEKAREEQRLKEKEVREQKERKERERKEQQQERERRDKDAKAKAEREVKETRDKTRQEERAAQKATALAATAVPVPITLPKRPAQQPPVPAAVPAAVPALPQQSSTSFASPQIPVATPAFPKVPTPMRPRQASQQDSTAVSSGATSQSGSAPSQNASPHPLTPVHASPGLIAPPSKSSSTAVNTQNAPQQPSPHSTSPLNMTNKALQSQYSPFMMTPIGLHYPPGISQAPPGMGNHPHREPLFPQMGGFRPAPGMVPMPPGLNGPTQNRFPIHPPPGFPGPGPMDSGMGSMAHILGPGITKDALRSHSRQGSGSFEAGTAIFASQAQPISRPAPIGRPGSVVHGQRIQSGSPRSTAAQSEMDTRLGSSALLDDLDDPIQEFPGRQHRGQPVLSASAPRPGAAFPLGPFGGLEPIFGQHHNPWGSPGTPQPNFYAGSPPGFGPPQLSTHHWGGPLQMSSAFGPPGLMDRPPPEPRSVAVRKMLRRACEQVADAQQKRMDGNTENFDSFIPLEDIKSQVAMYNGHVPVDEKELLDMCETVGNETNGGGSFDVRHDGPGQISIRFVMSNGRSNSQPLHRAVGAPGEIGSPIVGGVSFSSSR